MLLPVIRPSLAYEMHEIIAYVDNCQDHIPKILDVGCGMKSVVGNQLRESKRLISLHGLDIDNYALQNKDVDKVYISDVEHMPFDDGTYDIVVSQYMLEHIHDYRKSLREMARVVAKGGILVLRFPNPTSPEAIITRLTPFWFHIFFRKFIQKVVDADKHTFPTTFSFRTINNIIKELKVNDFVNVKINYFSETDYRFRRTPMLLKIIILYTNFLSKFKIDWLKSSVVIIAEK